MFLPLEVQEFVPPQPPRPQHGQQQQRPGGRHPHPHERHPGLRRRPAALRPLGGPVAPEPVVRGVAEAVPVVVAARARPGAVDGLATAVAVQQLADHLVAVVVAHQVLRSEVGAARGQYEGGETTYFGAQFAAPCSSSNNSKKYTYVASLLPSTALLNFSDAAACLLRTYKLLVLCSASKLSNSKHSY